MPEMKSGPNSIGITAISHSCSGVASRASGLVSLEPTRLYAPTTLPPARDFWLMRYTSVMEDGSLVPWSVPQVLCPLYESSTVLSQRRTMAIHITWCCWKAI